MIDVLVSTTRKTNLDFFRSNIESFKDCNYIVINQKGFIENCPENVRVFNSDELGLSRSRNLALNMSSRKVKLLTDDDVNFCPHFDVIVNKYHTEYSDVSVIIFKARTVEGADFRTYPNKICFLNEKELRGVCSIEISLKSFVSQRFDLEFGLGSKFVAGEEWAFLKDIHDSGGKILFVPEYIVEHDVSCSGFLYTKERIQALSASYMRNYKLAGILYIIYAFYLISFRHIYQTSLGRFSVLKNLIVGIFRFIF